MGSVSSIIVLVLFALTAVAPIAGCCIWSAAKRSRRGRAHHPIDLLPSHSADPASRVKPAMKLKKATALLKEQAPPPGFCVIRGPKRELPISIGNEKTVDAGFGVSLNFRARVILQTPPYIYNWECKQAPLQRLLEDIIATPMDKQRPWKLFAMRSAVDIPPALRYSDLDLFDIERCSVHSVLFVTALAFFVLACISLFQTGTFAHLPSGYHANVFYWLLVSALLVSEQFLTCNWSSATYYPTIWTTSMALVATVMINVLLANNTIPLWVEIILLLSVVIFWTVAIFRCYAIHRDPALRNSGTHQLRSVRRNMYIGVSVLVAFYTLLSITGLGRLGSLGLAIDWILKLAMFNVTAHVVIFLGSKVSRKTQQYYLTQMVGDLRGLMIENGIPIPVDSNEDQVKVSLFSQEDQDEGEDSSMEEPDVAKESSLASTRSSENSGPLPAVVQQVTPPPPITPIAPGSGNLRAFL